MAIETKCLTPGALFTTHIGSEMIVLAVGLPRAFVLSEDEAEQLEHNLHNAVELALAPLFLRAEN